jgi:hypothetical protein
LATIQPELVDDCLDWMACISIEAAWLLLVILLRRMYEFWRTGRVTGLELLMVGSGIAAALCSHKPRPFLFLLGTGFGRYLIERKTSVCTAPVAYTATGAINY